MIKTLLCVSSIPLHVQIIPERFFFSHSEIIARGVSCWGFVPWLSQEHQMCEAHDVKPLDLHTGDVPALITRTGRQHLFRNTGTDVSLLKPIKF